MKITICGSIAFLEKMKEAKEKLEKMGHVVNMPPLEVEDGEGNLIPATEYYRIRKENKRKEDWIWERKKWAMKKHFNKVALSEAILVLNYDKNNIKGYVGGNTLLEMGLALHLGKKIFMINPIPEMSCKEEIMGMRPVIIKEDLNLIA